MTEYNTCKWCHKLSIRNICDYYYVCLYDFGLCVLMTWDIVMLTR